MAVVKHRGTRRNGDLAPRARPSCELSGVLVTVALLVTAACSSIHSRTPAAPSSAAESPVPVTVPATSAGASAPRGTGALKAAQLCQLWTASEITAAAGVPLARNPPKNDAVQQQCSWSQNEARGASLLVTAMGADSLDPRVTASPPAGISYEHVSGIGDDAAVEVVVSNSEIFFWVKKGQNVVSFTLNVPNLPATEIRAREETLAIAAASRL